MIFIKEITECRKEMFKVMENWEELVDLYTDYLIVVNGQATATGLSDVLDNKISHDKFTRMLQGENLTQSIYGRRLKRS